MLIDLVLHADDFVKGVKNIVSGVVGEFNSEASDSLTIDEIVSAVIPELLPQMKPLIDEAENRITSKVQSMLDRGLKKFEDAFVKRSAEGVIAAAIQPQKQEATSSEPAPKSERRANIRR